MKHLIRRVAARLTDYLLWGMLTSVISGNVQSISPFVFFYVSFWVYLLTEALLISRFGATVGKRLFGIRIFCTDGKKLSFFKSLKRSFLVFGIGFGFFLPYISLISPLIALVWIMIRRRVPWEAIVPDQVEYVKTTAWDKLILTLFVLFLAGGYFMTARMFYLSRQPDYASMEDKFLETYFVQIRPQLVEALSEEAVLTPQNAEQTIKKLNDIQQQIQNQRNELEKAHSSLTQQFHKIPIEEVKLFRQIQAKTFFDKMDSFLFSESMRADLFKNIIGFFEDEEKNKYVIENDRPLFNDTEMQRQYDNYMTQLQLFLMTGEDD